MTRAVACRRCGKPNRKSLCDSCDAATYGSTEYAANSKMIRRTVKLRMAYMQSVVCCICGQRIVAYRDVTIEHVKPVSAGGGNDLANLDVAHSACNYAKRPRPSLRLCMHSYAVMDINTMVIHRLLTGL